MKLEIESVVYKQANGQNSLEHFLTSLFEFHDDADVTSCASQAMNLDRMFEVVTRSRFRRTKLDEKSQVDIREKISAALERCGPIEFAIPFGAYKHWLLPSYPYPDWAEVFNLKHLVAFAAPIAKSYPPGVVLNYTYTSSVMEKVSNLPTEAQDEYISALKMLHSHFQRIAPPGLTLRLVDIRQSYERGQLESELEQNFIDNTRNWVRKYSNEVRAKKLQSARNNLVLTGIEDLTALNAEELEERFLKSAMWCDALDSLILRRGFNKYGHCIQLVFIRGPNLSLHIGSCRGSTAHFWVGAGVVEERDKSLMETIITDRKVKQLLDECQMKEVAVKNCSPIPLISLQSVFVMR